MEQVRPEEFFQHYKTALVVAELAREKAYSPYSKFYVGAALVLKDGRAIMGMNIENASYGLTTCAERSAVIVAHSQGHWAEVKCLIITTRKEDTESVMPAAPCGACRQILFEMAQVMGSDLPIYLCSTDRQHILKTSLSELLPAPFGPNDLGIDLSKYH